MKNSRLLVLGAAILLTFTSCAAQNLAEQENSYNNGTAFSVVNWNVQTFFDGTKDGVEYSDFQKAGNWNNEKYTARLERLCQAITQLDADIYIFEEIENEAVIYDISNQLSADGHNWNQRKFWNYSVFAKQEGTAIGIGILSRYPLSGAVTHAMDIRLFTTKQPSVRPILEVNVSIEQTNLIILANHWKSKSGGEENTEIWRDWQESTLANRLIELKEQHGGKLPPVLICGDFNRDVYDFICSRDTILLRSKGLAPEQNINVNSLWLNKSGQLVTKTGSYYYDGQWERIDNIMLGGKIECLEFKPLANQPWATQEGLPFAYRLYSGEGWSDHLPIQARLVLTE